MAQGKPRVRYRTREGFDIYPVNGVFGGPTPRGEIVCRFFLEVVEPPPEVGLELIPNTADQYRELPPKTTEGIRQIQTGILLTPQQAYSIGEWLMNHAKSVNPQLGRDQNPEVLS